MAKDRNSPEDFEAETEERSSTPGLEQMFTDAEENLRRGIETLGAWSDQARDVIQNRPGVVLASISIAGFMTGLMARGGRPLFERTRGRNFKADPLIVFLTGAFAGFTLGPRVLRELNQGIEPRPESAERSASGLTTAADKTHSSSRLSSVE